MTGRYVGFARVVRALWTAAAEPPLFMIPNTTRRAVAAPPHSKTDESFA